MKKLLQSRVFVFVVTFILISFVKELERSAKKQNYSKTVVVTAPNTPVNEQKLLDEQDRLQNGVAHSVLDNSTLDAASLTSSLGHLPNNKKYWSFGFSDSKSRIFTYAASALNKKHYLANSFLLGFVPFETDKVWVPLATLSQRKRYLFDHKLYGPHMQDVWQNSKQAYAYSHGDCEDHSILLADWLIAMGLDAKVALGDVPSGGHAWVVLNYKGIDYVLEATNKRRINSIHDFELASRATDYWPEILFNRDSLWVNTGSKFTTRYRGNHWQLRSHFKRDRQLSEADLKF